MANILENLEKIHAAVVLDRETKQGELGAAISELAVKAIMSGIGEPDWKKYMSIFADNAAQLQLLTQVGPNDPSYMPQTRAYIVANSVCAPATEADTPMGVNTEIANVAPDNVDGSVQIPSELDGLFPVA